MGSYYTLYTIVYNTSKWLGEAQEMLWAFRFFFSNHVF